MSKAEELINEDGKYFAASGRIKYYPLAIDHGYGATLVDVDGKEYIDLLSSASSQNVGHAPKPVTEAIKKQAEKFIHYTPARDALTLLVLQMHIMGQHLDHYPCLPLV